MASQADDEAQLLRLDSAWNAAYLRNDRASLADILADDFTALDASGEPFGKASLMINPPPASSAAFSEQSVRVFGEEGLSRGRRQLELHDRRVDQRFLRVFARRNGAWRAVSVAVTPLADQWIKPKSGRRLRRQVRSGAMSRHAQGSRMGGDDYDPQALSRVEAAMVVGRRYGQARPYKLLADRRA